MSRFSIRAVNGARPDLVEALVAIQRQVFPARMQDADPHRYFGEALEKQSHLNIVAEDEKGTIAGYLLGIPQDEVFEELRRRDPAIRRDPDCIYVEILQVSPNFQGRNLTRRLFGSLCVEAEKRGIRKLSMHARSTTGLSKTLVKIFASACTLRRLENWFGSNEPFDYLEAAAKLRKAEKSEQK